MYNTSLFQSDISDIETVFGNNTSIYVDLCKRVHPHVLGATYYFEDRDIFENKCKNGKYKAENINEIYWREILFRAHITVVSSLIRTCRLMDATAREYSVSNIPGWTSCARALLENTGDSIDVLQYIPVTISKNYKSINRCISGRENRGIYTSTELEGKLIEFSHARRPERGEIAPDSHTAKPTGHYIGTLEKYLTGDTAALYKKLCEFSHPSSNSVQYMFSPTGDGASFCISDRNDQIVLNILLRTHHSLFDQLIMLIFNSIFVTLRLLDEFNLFPRLPDLREINFTNISLWSNVIENIAISQ